MIGGDAPINQLHIEIDSRCFTLLALHQPMAVDLRAIVSAVKINTDLERVGDLAINIAEAVRRYMRHPPVKELIDIPRMADIAQAMLRDALDAYVRRDIELAQHVLNEDDELDALKTQVFRELLTYMLQDPSTIEPSLDLILDFPPSRAHRRPRHQRRRGRDLHGLGQGRPPPRRRSRARAAGPNGPERRRAEYPSPRIDTIGRFDAARTALCVLPHAPGRPGVAAVLQRAVQACGPRPLADGRLPGA